MPLFTCGPRPEPSGCGQPPPPMPAACSVQNVRIANPCDPLDAATVFLGVDERGNLIICVRRDPPCRCRRGR